MMLIMLKILNTEQVMKTLGGEVKIPTVIAKDS